MCATIWAFRSLPFYSLKLKYSVGGIVNVHLVFLFPSDADPECTNLDGVFAIKENCAMFYVCMKGQVSIKQTILVFG